MLNLCATGAKLCVCVCVCVYMCHVCHGRRNSIFSAIFCLCATGAKVPLCATGANVSACHELCILAHYFSTPPVYMLFWFANFHVEPSG